MSKPCAKLLSLVLVLTLLVSVVTPALAATYRPGAQSGPSSSYASGVYYENYKRIPITGDNRTDLIAIALSQLGHQPSGKTSLLTAVRVSCSPQTSTVANSTATRQDNILVNS